METTNKIYLHGECLIAACLVPAQAKPLQLQGPTIKLADSETTGNHHLLDVPERCEFYELDGVRYMRNPNPATVRCVLPDRHDTIKIPAGEWVLDQQLEYDYLTESARTVTD